MEQRCPIPGGGGERQEEGTGSYTCQADSGFEIPEEQNGTREAICLQYREGHKPEAQRKCIEKRWEMTCFTQVPSMTLHCRIPSSGRTHSRGWVNGGENTCCSMWLVFLELIPFSSLKINSIFPKGLMDIYLCPSGLFTSGTGLSRMG